MIKEILKRLEFSQGEITIYLYLLEHKEQTPKEISLRTSISLSKTYEILEKLTIKGVITQLFKENKKYFETLPLELVESLLEEQENQIQKDKQVISKIIQEKKEKKGEKESSKVKIYTNYNGIKAFYKNIEKNNQEQEYLGFMLDEEILENKTILRLIDNFHKKRALNNKTSKIIIEKSSNYNSKRLNSNPYEKYQFKATHLPFPKNTSIIGNKVIFYNSSGNNYEIIEIESSSMSTYYKELFNNIWKA